MIKFDQYYCYVIATFIMSHGIGFLWQMIFNIHIIIIIVIDIIMIFFYHLLLFHIFYI